MSTSYSKEISEIIRQSNFRIAPGTYVYAKVPAPVQFGDHFMVSQDHDEITVVTLKERVGLLPLLERNKDDYALVALNVSIPFYSVGFLATVTDALAKEGLNVLVISTFSRDYIMVRADLIGSAAQIRRSLGFTEGT